MELICSKASGGFSLCNCQGAFSALCLQCHHLLPTITLGSAPVSWSPQHPLHESPLLSILGFCSNSTPAWMSLNTLLPHYPWRSKSPGSSRLCAFVFRDLHQNALYQVCSCVSVITPPTPKNGGYVLSINVTCTAWSKVIPDECSNNWIMFNWTKQLVLGIHEVDRWIGCDIFGSDDINGVTLIINLSPFSLSSISPPTDARVTRSWREKVAQFLAHEAYLLVLWVQVSAVNCFSLHQNERSWTSS